MRLLYRSTCVLFTITLGCSIEYDSPASLQSSNSGNDMTAAEAQRLSVSAFAKHTLPLLQEMCASCHGNDQSPLFAVSDATQAHQTLIAGDKVNFDNINNSRLVLRLTEDNHNCEGDCQADGKKIAAALTAWKSARATTEESTKTIATDSMNPSGTKRLRYDIGKLIDAQYGNETIMLQVDIKPLSAGGGYVLSNIKVETIDEPVYIKGIKPLVNGEWNQLNSSLTGVACAAHPPASKLSEFSESTILVEDMNAEHQLAFAFKEIRIATAEEQNCEQENTEKGPYVAKQKEFNQAMRRNFRYYCSCHISYFEGNTAFNSVWANKKNIVNRMTVSNDRIMPPAVGAVALPNATKEAMLKWLGD